MPEVGKTISHYKILKKLGEGGMGVVYKAEDTKLKRDVALKFLPPELTGDLDARSRFVREAQTASALDHPNIGAIHEIDESDDGRTFICMALYDGETLKQKIERGPLGVDETVSIAMQVVSGLQKAHDAGIVHRDIKPGNIIVTRDGTVKIVDFGLAKLSTAAQTVSEKGRPGTAAYMSPEQIQNGVVDARSDLFSLGVVLYEMLTGTRPFGGEHEAALFYSIIYNEPAPPRSIRSGIPKVLEEIVMQLLQKNPAKRPQTAIELFTSLKELSAGPVGAKALPKIAGVSRFISRRNLAIASVITLLAATILLNPFGWRSAVYTIFGIGVPAEKRVVVLPFTCIGCDQKETAMSDGLMETMTSALTEFQPSKGSLWVVASSEVRGNDIRSPREARRVFGANLVVTGSMQHEENGLRLTLNLVDPRTSRQLRSQLFDESSANISRLQDRIVDAVTELLDIKLEPQSLNIVRAGATDKSSAYELYLEGRGYMQRYETMKNLDVATSLFRKAFEVDPGYALAYAGLGEAYWKMFENDMDPHWVDSAIAYCAKAAQLNDRLVPVRITLGIIYAGTGQNEKAVSQFEDAIRLDPVNGYAYSELGKAYSHLGDTVRAEAAFRKAVSISPTYWGFHSELGRYYITIGRMHDAVREYRKVVELTPDNHLGYNNLGALYFYLNQWDSALAVFEKSIALQPNYHGYSNLGTLLYYKGDLAGAAQAYEKALKLDDKNCTVWANLAAAYLEMGQRDNSANAYRMAVKKAEAVLDHSPQNAELTWQIAAYCLALGDSGKARKYLSKSLSLAPNNVVLLGHIAMSYEELGERGEALELLAIAFRKGYSPTEVENAPEMKNLRADKRYQQLLKGLKK